MAAECGPAFHAMQVLECTHARPGIRWNIGHPYLLAGTCALLAFCHVISQAKFPGAQKQQPPG